MADSDYTPDLPPHLLAKRKRQQEEKANNDAATASGARRAASPDEPEKRRKIGPALPAQRSSSPAQETQTRRVAGPAPPPAPLDERPTEPLPAEVPESDDSSDDDDFGPALPSAAGDVTSTLVTDEDDEEQLDKKVKRDDWMMMPPKQDDLAARLDPLKARPTKFAGKGASKGDTDSSAWHETPEQKQKRLRDEMMGISSSKPTATAKLEPGKSAKMRKDEEARKLVNAKSGPSLMEQHEKTKGPEAVDDDPSKRAFDREKDMGAGGRISNSQKKEMLNKAAGFAGKFAGGSYL